ncbi:MAG: L,D-transpeptidase [Sphingomonadaceae bacterium]
MSGQRLTDIRTLKPNQFTWHPERSPTGPVAIVVSIPDQQAHVYRGGIRIGVSTCSTGKPGHETPTGVFTILQKDKNHRSSAYNNAPMPNMNRLTWDGIALHAGNLPGYPASHGCVRLPVAFSEKLFGITHVGTPVILAGSHADPIDIVHPGLILANGATERMDIAIAKLGRGAPSAPAGAVTVLVSAGSREATLLDAGRSIASSPLRLSDGEALGEHVFSLAGLDATGNAFRWQGIGYADAPGVPVTAPQGSILRRVGATADFSAAVRDRLHPGMLLVMTDLPLHPDRQSAKDFVILSS